MKRCITFLTVYRNGKRRRRGNVKWPRRASFSPSFICIYMYIFALQNKNRSITTNMYTILWRTSTEVLLIDWHYPSTYMDVSFSLFF